MGKHGSVVIRSLLFLPLLCARLVILPDHVNAWGNTGHRVLALVAADRLSNHARQEVRALLGQRSLADVALLPDTWKKTTRKETAPWHFVDIPKGETAYDPARDCKDGACVIDAIARQQAVLADQNQSKEARTEALIFLIHLVGDAHQPLHCADNNDRGGNDVHVRFFGNADNLHAVWDTSLIKRTQLGETAYVRKLKNWLASHSITDLQGGTVTDWAVEAHAIAVEHAYADVPARGRIGARYFERNLPFVDEQLAKAAIRLAKVLNDALP